MIFSILMCARNAESTIRKAITSVLNQSCSSWELLILDNGSTDSTWELIQQAMQEDVRIKGTHLESGVGWAKGASLCLQQAQGEYMTFLAADDFLVNDGSLYAVQSCIEKERPDIVWIGHAAVQWEGNAYTILGGRIPPFVIYEGKDKIFNTYDIMCKIYYNSFFHYMNIEFLRKNGIDFYEPYLGDCEGMTEAMCKADKMIMLDQSIYALTINTSQTSKSTTWRYNLLQWQSVKKALRDYGEYDKEKLRYIAIRIMNNNISQLTSICEGGAVRNEEMNLIEKSSLERFIYAENTLQKEEFIEMFYYAGREYYLQQVLEAIKKIYAKCRKDGFSEEEIQANVLWLPHLVEALCEWNGEEYVEREKFDSDSFWKMYLAICNDKNVGVWGYEFTKKMIPFLNFDVRQPWEEMTKKYVTYSLSRIYDLLCMAVEIKQRGRMKEVTKIIRECIEIFESQKEYLSAEEIQLIVGDIKKVASQI